MEHHGLATASLKPLFYAPNWTRFSLDRDRGREMEAGLTESLGNGKWLKMFAVFDVDIIELKLKVFLRCEGSEMHPFIYSCLCHG